jgi:hypothetical protein
MPRQLLENPTPRQLAKVLAPVVAPVVEAVESNGDGEQPQPLSHAQQRVWFMQQFEPAETAYNVTQLLALRGELDVPRLQRAWTIWPRRSSTSMTSAA